MNNTKNRFNLTWLKHLTIQVFFQLYNQTPD